MTVMLRKDLFVLRHGLFRRSHISDPTINEIKDLTLPRESVYHFLDPDGDKYGSKHHVPRVLV